MILQKIGRGSSANDGTGTDLRAGAQMINDNFDTLASRLNTRPIRMWGAGDSKSGEPWSAMRILSALSPLDVDVMTNWDVIGGSQTGNASGSPQGLTSTDRLNLMISTVAANNTAGFDTDIVITIGTNDYGASASPVTAIANVRKYFDNFKQQAGARFLLVTTMDPRTASTAATWAHTFNKLLALWASVERDIRIINTFDALLDWSSSNDSPIGGSSAVAGGVTYDGLHCTGFGEYRKHLPMASLLRSIYRARIPRFPGQNEAYATDRPQSNLLGGLGRMTAMGGTNSATNGTVTGTPPNGWTLTGDLQGLTFNFSAVNSAAVKTALGLVADCPVVRLSWSGTPAATTTMNLRRVQQIATAAGATIRPEAAFFMNPLGSDPVVNLVTVRIRDLAYTTQVVPYSTGHRIGTATSDGSLTVADPVPAWADGLYFMDQNLGYNAGSVSALFATSGLSFEMRFLSGVATSGTIDLIGCATRRWDGLPAASA